MAVQFHLSAGAHGGQHWIELRITSEQRMLVHDGMPRVWFVRSSLALHLQRDPLTPPTGEWVMHDAFFGVAGSHEGGLSLALHCERASAPGDVVALHVSLLTLDDGGDVIQSDYQVAGELPESGPKRRHVHDPSWGACEASLIRSAPYAPYGHHGSAPEKWWGTLLPELPFVRLATASMLPPTADTPRRPVQPVIQTARDPDQLLGMVRRSVERARPCLLFLCGSYTTNELQDRLDNCELACTSQVTAIGFSATLDTHGSGAQHAFGTSGPAILPITGDGRVVRSREIGLLPSSDPTQPPRLLSDEDLDVDGAVPRLASLIRDL